MRNPFAMNADERQEFILMLVVAVLGLLTLWRVVTYDMVFYDGDTRSHLNVARMVIDNFSPGINQLGIWNPLIHILLQPFIWYWPFYTTGAAGFCLLLPCLFLGVIFMRRMTLDLTEDRRLAFVAALLLAINPYALFFTVVPMTEPLLMMCILGTGCYLARWLKSGQLKPLIVSGVWASLACIARFESLGVAMAVGIVVIIECIKNKKSFQELFAISQLFWLVALLGMAYLVAYGVVYMTGPLAFMGLTGTSSATEHKTLLFTYQVVSHGLYHMHGIVYICGALLALAILLIFVRSHLRQWFVLFVLINPLIVLFYALYSRSLVLLVPELPKLNTGPPVGYFAGIRFLLSTTPFAILAIILAIDALKKWLQRMAPRLTEIVLLIALVLLVGNQAVRSVSVEANRFPAMQRGETNKLKLHNHILIANYLEEHYDRGLIIYYRAFSDYIQFGAHIPLKNYIYTANYPFFDQAVRFPWLFIRWAVLPTNMPPSAKLYIEMKYNKYFNKYFQPVMSVPASELVGFTVYKLNEEVLREDLTRMGVDLEQVPSLFEKVHRWDPADVNERLHLSKSIWEIEERYPQE